MKIALFGFNGMIGQRLAREALSRGHEVQGIARHQENGQQSGAGFTAVKGDILDPASVAEVVAGCDVVINATGARGNDAAAFYVPSAKSLIEGLTRAHVQRLIVVGGAGSLEIAPGVQLVDSPDFPAAWKAGALAIRDSLAVYRTSDLDWTFFSPAAFIAPGERTGSYQIGTDQLVTNTQGESKISAEDYAVALIDEVEQPHFIRRRFTAAYA
jgi:uncharacterized protein